ncbi:MULTISPECIES: N-acetylmuramoyl-L-alanine amidase [unclassified Pseudoxanthomonas]|uniref:N-acetylmuramoyl-L-alanine amidase n=1 Tax=unclassified Pseudoxanthomonas TaxID=2645906 RepID=UPI003076BDCF
MGNPTTRSFKLAAAVHLLAGTLLAGAGTVSAWAGEVSAVRVNQGATGTRAEIQLQGKGEYKTLSLAGPDRLVVDLPASSAAKGLTLPAGTGIIKSVRTGQPEPGTLRIVFDLASAVVPLKPRMESSSTGARLVIEWPGDGPAPSAAVATTPSAPAATTATPPAPSQATPPAVDPQAEAARATAALSAQVVKDLAQNAPTSPPSSSPAGQPSPQAILNGQAANQPSAPSASSATPPYTIATGKPEPIGANAAAGQVPSAEQAIPAATAAKPASDPSKRSGTRPLVIAIDPGHGGQDSGAVGPGGTYEKNVVLAIARELSRQINATPGMKAYLTRESDVFIPLPQRARKARAAGADMFVSIHADAAENRSARGSSVYVLSLKGASSQRARWLADKENASDLIGGVPLQKVDNTLSSVLLDLAQSGHMKASEDAANHVLDGLKRVGNNHKPNIERANFAVLRTSDIPAMLVETAFISNAEEERRLKDPAYQRKVASAVLDGVNTYFTRQPPPGTLFAARAQAEAEAKSRGVASGGTAGAP